MTLCLTPAELHEVTGYRRGADQLAYFRALGIPAHRRPDGSVSVVKQHLLELRRLADAQSASRPHLRSDHAQEKSAQSRLPKARLILVR